MLVVYDEICDGRSVNFYYGLCDLDGRHSSTWHGHYDHISQMGRGDVSGDVRHPSNMLLLVARSRRTFFSLSGDFRAKIVHVAVTCLAISRFQQQVEAVARANFVLMVLLEYQVSVFKVKV